MKNSDLIIAAEMASLAYQPTVHLDGFVVTQYINSNIQWFSARRDNDLWIVFRGTDEPEDWAANLDALKRNSGPWHVHAGFNTALNTVWGSVMEEINRSTTGHLYFVGHSLGGAMAALAVSRLVFGHWCPRMSLITFGQPRCGDAVWAKEMKTMMCDRYARVINAGDIVHHLPTFMRFRHAGTTLFFDDDGIPTSPTLRRRLISAMDVVLAHLWTSVLGFEAHSMSRYRDNVLRVAS
ncbi:MAG: lipase family protein [Magnetococcus sp. YQC-5]